MQKPQPNTIQQTKKKLKKQTQKQMKHQTREKVEPSIKACAKGKTKVE